MDFFESQEKARRKTTTLVAYFVLAIVLMNLAIYAGTVTALGVSRPTLDPIAWWQPTILVVVMLVTCGVISLGSLHKTIQLRQGGGASVASLLGGQPVPPNTTDKLERRLLNVVEEMALAAGVPVPPVYVLEDEQSINAFAAGFTVGDAVIGVNRGTLRHLSRSELQGVIAHEFSHILNGDMRLNLRLMGLLSGILLVSTIGYYFMRFGGGGHSSGRQGKGGGHLGLIGLVAFVIGYVGLFFARLIKAAVSRQREYLADASAVQFTRDPAGMAGALKKIGGLPAGSTMISPEAESASHLFFGTFRDSWWRSFATHPPLIDRVRRLDPAFDGRFPVVDPRHPASEPKRGTAKSQKSPFEALQRSLPSVGGDRLPIDPAVLLATIGSLTTNHGATAHQLLESFPAGVRDALHDPFTARLVILAILLDDDVATRKKQLAGIQQRLGERAVHEMEKMAPSISQLERGMRLPLFEIAHSTLQQLSPDQYRDFRTTVKELILADEQVNFLEFTVLRTLLARLDRLYGHASPPTVRYLAVGGVVAEVSDLISTIIHLGNHNDQQAATAFGLASQTFSRGNELTLRPRSECSMSRLNDALEKLAATSLVIKRRVIRAASVAVACDGYVTPEEAELFRAIGDSLDCPVPPLYTGTIAHGTTDELGSLE